MVLNSFNFPVGIPHDEPVTGSVILSQCGRPVKSPSQYVEIDQVVEETVELMEHESDQVRKNYRAR